MLPPIASAFRRTSNSSSVAGRGRDRRRSALPLHGLRFHIVITRDLYRAFRFYITDYKEGWPRQSAQYQKAMRTSFDWALWPPQKEKDKEFGQDSVLILRDGTELPAGDRL